jgi:hypothetical protein
LTFGVPTGIPSNDIVSLSRFWVSATHALVSVPADRNWVKSVIKGRSPPELGSPEDAAPVGKADPVVGKTEPVVGKTEPVVGKTEPVVGKTEPVVGKTEPVVGETEPVVGKPGSVGKTEPVGKTVPLVGKSVPVVGKAVPVGNTEVGSDGAVRPEPGSAGMGGNEMSVGAGCEGAAVAAPTPNPKAASANPAHAAAPMNSRPGFEIVSICSCPEWSSH